MGRTWKAKPSDIYFIDDEIAAWCFDRAVTLFGYTVENEMALAASKAQRGQEDGARQAVLNAWLKEGRDGERGMFKDPAKMQSF